MTREDIIRMARQVEAEGFAPVGVWPEVRRLCELAYAAGAAAERNSWPAEMEAMERQVNILTDALAQAKAEEREACARVCEDIDAEYEGEDVLATWCAAAIRARGG